MNRRSRMSKYINIEASEDSEEESEDLDNTLIQPEYISTTHTDITRQIEEKYSYSEKLEQEEELEEDIEDNVISQTNLLPKKSSPRLFLVRVKHGKEREIGLKILNTPSNICSIIVKEGLKGYIYVEAFQKQQVIDSFDKIRGINKTKVVCVPQNEMVEALTYKLDYKHVEFGRIKKGKYKGDLVQIVESNGEMVKVRVMPRLNGVKKLFNHSEYLDEVIPYGNNIYIYKKDMFVNGYLEKEMLRSNLDFDVEPVYDELDSFKQQKSFNGGDKVKVTKGELIGIKGIVESVHNGIVCIKEEGNNYQIQDTCLCKYWDIGDEVRYGVNNGVVINIKEDVYYVAIRNFTEEISVCASDLSKSVISKEVIREERTRPVIKRDCLINKQVQIRKGPYKGYIGLVKDVYMNTCRVQVSSNLKDVTVPKDYIIIKEIQDTIYTERTSFPSAVTKTPAYEQDRVEYMKDKSIKGAYVEVNGSTCVVEYTLGDTYATNAGIHPKRMVRYVSPQKEDMVVIMEGVEKGKSAILLEYDTNGKSVVKILNGNIKSVPYNFLSKKEMFKL